ncbi:uncharacterized protein LOC144136568 [Amblyomma americanum]
MAYGDRICGKGTNCKALPNGGFQCVCQDEEYFDLVARKCLPSKNCETEGCPVGKCELDKEKSTRSCVCNAEGLTDDCKVKPEKKTECEDAKAKPNIKPDGTVTCECDKYEKKINGSCEDVICLDPSFQCRQICGDGFLDKAQAKGCCQGWKNENGSCKASPSVTPSCNPGQVVNEGKCESACKNNKQEKICGERSCKIEGGSFTCTCNSDEQLQGNICKPKPKCDEKRNKECSEIGALCTEPAGECICKNAQKKVNDRCTDICTLEYVKNCQAKINGECAVEKGSATCVCRRGMKKNKLGVCQLAQTTTVKFRIKKRTTRYSTEEEDCALPLEQIITALKEKVPDFDERDIKCRGEDVELDAFTENEEAVKALNSIFEMCTTPAGHEGCLLGNGVYIEQDSVQMAPTELCDKLTYITENTHLVCTYDENNKTVFLCNNETSVAVGNAETGGLSVQVCHPLPCSQTCVQERKQCILQACVCKPQYKLNTTTNECQSYCEIQPSVCPAEAECKLGTGDQSYYCKCPPKFTGPLCTQENKPLQSAKLNIVIVGVVLSSLLLMCFVVSASIISRLKKKARGPNFSKDVERRTPRELRGYEGPYRASDPASLQKDRDLTSL